LFVQAVKMSDAVTTVSETFGLESQDSKLGEGVSFAVREAAKVGKLVGIINGTNPTTFNPETDRLLKDWKDIETKIPLDLSYGPTHPDIMGQRALCKEQLGKWVNTYMNTSNDKKVDIDFSKPLVTYVGRFDHYQKGMDKFEEAIESTLKNGGQFICMGIGETDEAKQILDNLEKKYSKGVLFIRDYRESGSGKLFYQQGSGERPGIGSLIRVASDFVLIPSRFEPCGLVQFEGWLFGSLAIGSKTGGLVDTIIPLEKDKDAFNGFLFSRDNTQSDSCSAVIKKALDFWNHTEKDTKNAIIKRLITTGRQYGWTTSPTKHSPVERYRYLYQHAKQRVDRGVRKVGETIFKKYDPLDGVTVHSNVPIEDYTKKEEAYLANYYNAKNISKQALEKLYFDLPRGAREKLPHPSTAKGLS